ncbi:MAG: hypothetical protein GY801_15955 [bacterium]|nr:hypothetical protein [bacterium]
MPGKVNPVILEATISVALKVQTNDMLIANAASRGTLQINEFLPVIAFSLLESLEMLNALGRIFEVHVSKIIANQELCRQRVNNSPVVMTAFLPHIGYERAETLLQEFHSQHTHMTFREFLNQQLGQELVDTVLSPHNLMALGYRKR